MSIILLSYYLIILIIKIGQQSTFSAPSFLMQYFHVNNNVMYQAIIADLDQRQEAQRSNQDVVIRKLMRRKSKRETKAIWSEIRNGVLRRTNSVEDVSENVGLTPDNVIKDNGDFVNNCSRVRHNSEGGHYDDLAHVTVAAPVTTDKDESGTDNVYENVTFFQGSAKFGDKKCNSRINNYDNLNSDIQKFISHATR